MEHDSHDSGALPPLLFEPELDSDGQQSLEENTPPDSALFPNSAKRNEAKLSLSSYQSVTLGEVTPTREVSPNDFKDNDIPGNDVTPKQSSAVSAQEISDTESPQIVSNHQKTGNDVKNSNQKTSTPRRQEMAANQHTAVFDLSSEVRPRTASRVSFQKDDDAIDPSDVRVPVTGYEIMEQRARFTVFKLHVHRGRHDNWFVFRRYTDFVQLQNKLKLVFPTFRFALPPKRWFRDNYDKTFLEDRQLGLQGFIDSVLCHRDVCNSQPVQEFFCFNDPPGQYDSLEEGRAYCESLEDAIYTMKKDLKQKDGEIDLLKEELTLYKSQVEMLSRALREKNENGAKKAVLSPANSMAECDHLAPEADQSQDKIMIEAEIHQSQKRIRNGASQSQPRKHSPASQRNVDGYHSKTPVSSRS